MHWPLQLARGALQLQLPAMHSSSEAQVVPHAPQLRRSDETSRQRPLQNDWPLGHPWEQVPPWQTAPAAQAVPHAPQLASSVSRSEQRPEQVVSPVAQPTTPG